MTKALLHREPCLDELARLGPVGLHARATTRLPARGIGPLEREAEPGTVALERVIIDNNPDAGPLLLNLGDFCRVGVSRHRPVAGFVVPDVVRSDTVRD